MSGLLIDSHELIWLLFEPERIKPQSRSLILDADSVKVSIASIWELALKHNKGKLAYRPEELLEGVDVLGAQLLPVKPHHILRLQDINTAHKDPFDRMLLTQARTEGLRFLTADKDLLKAEVDYIVDARV